MSGQLWFRFLVLAGWVLILTGGCRVVRISDNLPPRNGSPRTTYSLTDMTSSGRPVYKSDTSDMYWYYISESGGKWVVGGTVGALDGYIMYVTDNHFNADEITGTFFTLDHGIWVESAEVSVSCTVENVALGKPASQSSTDGANTAGLAVDGEKGASVPGNQCTLTNPEVGPWWQVDLERNNLVGRVRVLNRGDCCGGRLHGFVVQVKRDGQPIWRHCGAPYSETPEEGQSITVDCGSPMVARYVRIQLPGKSERLSLCEVEVFTDMGCPTGYIVHGGVCYKPYNIPKTRHEALTTCQQDGGTLAMPRHRHTNMFLRKLAVLVDIVSPYWIGLFKENGAWGWEDGNPLCGYQQWGAGYPSTTDNNCTVLRFDGSWQDLSCETTAKFICQIQAPVDLATVGYQQHGEAFFRVSRRKKSFDESVAACGQFGGGRLAQPQTKEINDYVKGKIGESSPDGIARIGIKLVTTEESWSFLDGTPGDTSYSNWAPREPSGRGCVTMASDGGWQIGNCEEEAHYVCQIGDERSCKEQTVTTVYCGGSRGGSSGRISSPGYEENVNYPNNLQCQWDITVPGEDDVIEFTMEEIELDQTDRLEIHDVCVHGYNLANLTGSVVNESSPIIASTNRATLSFTSDDSYSARGFKLAYRAVPPPQSRSLRSLENVQDMQGADRRKRALPVASIVGGILSGVKEVFKIWSTLEDDQRRQQIINVMTQLKGKLDDVDSKLDEQGITNELNHQMQITATKYSASVTRLNNLNRIMDTLYVDSSGSFQPGADAQGLAETVLRQDSEGMSQILFNMFDMVMGSPLVIESKSIVETMEAVFRHQNLENSVHRAKLESISEFAMERQVSGYGLWVFALKQTGREDEIDRIMRRARSTLSEQMCFLAPFFYDWPAGTYGLPKTTEGCPSGSNVVWEEGQYEHRGSSSFEWPTDAQLHFNATFAGSRLSREFCLKTNPSSGGNSWPPGRYCVLKKGSCPVGLKWGKLGFPGGSQSGAVPDGSVASDTIEVEYCCQEDGFAFSPIALPPRRSFYLLRLGGACQQVAGMVTSEEWIEYRGNGYRAGVTPDDDGDDNSHKLYYCFYSVPGSVIPTTPIVPDVKNNDTTRIIIIVASTVGGALFLICVCVLCCCCRRD